MTYTVAAVLGVVLTVLLERVGLRTGLLRRRLFWVSYSIVVCFQLVINGILTGRDVVKYDPDVILGLRVGYAPVEDLLFGFALVAQSLLWWVWLGRREATHASPQAPDAHRSR